MITTSTSPLASAGASGTLAITSPGVVAGTASLPVFAGPANPARVGIYLQASPDFVGGFTLLRRGSGYQAGASAIPQNALKGDGIYLAFSAPAPLANLAGMDSITLVVTDYSGGNIVLSVVQ